MVTPTTRDRFTICVLIVLAALTVWVVWKPVGLTW